MKKRPVFEEKDLGINNFSTVDNFTFPVNEKYKHKLIDGNWIDDGIDYEYDGVAYTKVFITPDSRKLLGELPSYAKDLLMWLIMEVEKGKEYVWLRRDRYMLEMKVKSPTTVSLAVRALKTHYLQETKVREIYYINPAIFFHGDRVVKFRKNIKNNVKQR